MNRTKTQPLLLPFAMLGVAAFFYLYEFLLRVAPSVLYESLTQEFGLNAKTFGFLASSYYWSYAFLQLPIGAWVDKYGPRRLLTFAIVLCALSTIAFAYTGSFMVAWFARFFIGAGSAFAFICCMKIITIWFPPNWFPILVGVTLMLGTLGAVASIPLSFAMNYMPWRQLLVTIGGAGLVLGLLSWLLVRDHNPNQSTPELIAECGGSHQVGFWVSVREVALRPFNWVVGIYAFLVTAPTDALGGTWGVAFLEQVHHFSRDLATTAVAMTFLGMAVGSPLLGWIASVLHSRKKPMFFAAVIACLALFFVIYVPSLTVVWAGVGFFIFGAAGTYVLAFVVVREINHMKHVGTSVGFVNFLSILGSAILTSSIGWILDVVRTGAIAEDGTPIYTALDFHKGLLLVPLFYAVTAFIIVPLIRQKRDLA